MVTNRRRAALAMLSSAAVVALTGACDGSHHSATSPSAAPSAQVSGVPSAASSPKLSSSSAGTSSPAASSTTSPTASPSHPPSRAAIAPATVAARPPSATPRVTTTPKPTAKPSVTHSANPTSPAKASPTAVPTARPVSASGVDVLPGTHCQIFPTDNAWHADIASLPVDPHSAQWLAAMGASTRKLHPDFGPSYGAQSVPYGIPITVVPAAAKRVPVSFTYADESDKLLYPLSASTSIEGGSDSDGDRHAIMVTADTCELFETWDTHNTASGWTAGSGAHWALNSDALRPDGWTSADAAGLPILPGLLRYDEVASGHVDHAIRFSTNLTDEAHIWPARHDAGSSTSSSLPPMGARFRLKASFVISHYSAQAQTVLRAMQTYGLVLADNGSPWFFQGTADTAWPDALISALKTIPASAFEAVNISSLEISPNSGAAR